MNDSIAEAALGRLLLAFIDHGRASVSYEIWSDVEMELCEFLRDRRPVSTDEHLAASALLSQLEYVVPPPGELQ